MNNSDDTLVVPELREVFAFGVPLQKLPVTHLQIVVRYVLGGVSVLLNMTVIIVVVCSRQLHLPRHIYWAGASIVILFLTAQWVDEVLIPPSGNHVACLFYELSSGVWYPTLLLFLSLAGLDRYAAIKHYEWYKKRVTNRKAIFAMAVSFTLTGIIGDAPFWLGYDSPHDCNVNLTHVYWIVTCNVALGAVNIVLQVKLFLVSRKIIREYFSNSVQTEPIYFFSSRGPLEIPREYRFYLAGSDGVVNHIQTAIPPSNEQTPDTSGSGSEIACFPWPKTNRPRMDRLDFRAALILSANVLPFWLGTFPFAFNIMAMYWCYRLELDCSPSLLLTFDVVSKFLFVVPGIYMPVMYVSSSSEFNSALCHLFHKTESRFTSVNRSNRREISRGRANIDSV